MVETHSVPGSIDDTADYISMVIQEAVPEAMSWEEIKSSSDSCQVVQKIIEALRTGQWDKCSTSIKAVRAELNESNGVVLRGKRIFIPQSLQTRVLLLAHEGHQGIVKCKQWLRGKVWWVGMDKDVERLCKTSCTWERIRSGPAPI